MTVAPEFSTGTQDPWATPDPVQDWPPDQIDLTAESGTPDPDAPYGRKADGTPYKVPPEQRESLRQKLAAGRAKRSATAGQKAATRAPEAARGRPRGSTTKPAEPSPRQRYATTIAGVLTMPVFALGIASRFNPVFGLDAAALSLATPALAEAGADWAMDNARLGAMLDRAGNVTPVAGLLIAVLELAAQLAANHRMVPAIPELGILSPEELIAKATGDGSHVQS